MITRIVIRKNNAGRWVAEHVVTGISFGSKVPSHRNLLKARIFAEQRNEAMGRAQAG